MTQPACIDDFEHLAKARLPKAAWDYYASGANDMETLQDNCEAFRRYRVRPRVLRDVSRIDTASDFLGFPASCPIGIAPSAMQCMAHPDGERATSQAVAQFQSCMILSTYSTTPLEEVVKPTNASYWFQLYLYQNRPVSADLIRRAERAGYRALVLTVDTPQVGRRLPDARNVFKLPKPWRLANFPKEFQILTASERAAAGRVNQGEMDELTNESLGNRSDTTLTWVECIPWLRQVTSLPIILKGILTQEDALLAVKHGCDGIIVSNHGGRQLDSVSASIDALPEVVAAVKGRLEVYVDGGIRRGSDVFKALALGAKGVFIGRPALWGLGYNGQQGVEEVLKILHDELRLTMALAGCRSIAEINPGCLCKSKFVPAKL
ncbi:Hydroxyacid oxidase 2 [Dispira parvispora]|uniref:Oxidase FUB9 n=1 Tax=Dispira parvispora TaxID=1520584 RepID=A0A9W8ATN4_9FUNG|nr:Hydroxyacid oxidase 2 [Dispira parvispora]